MVRRKKHTREYVEKYIKPKEGDLVLDLGCGPADILDFLPKVKYYGFDLSFKYIDRAKKKYGERGTFFCKKLTEINVPAGLSFDVVTATNVLHHLNDEEAIQLFSLAKECLKSGGRLITCDGYRLEGEGLISKIVLSLDRGKYVRDKEGYLKLARQVFSNVIYETRSDLSNISVNGIFIICTKD